RDDAIAAPIMGPAGPAARPLRAAGSWIDRTRALTCLTAAIYYEAATEPDGGQRAVAQVVLNRAAHPAFPKTVCGVVYQGSERPSCQFSFACDGSMARRPMAAFWERARRVAADALAGNVYAPVGLATHYHTSAIHPYWADSLTFLGTIGAHRFYRWSGAAGRPAAFTTVYAGGEPLAAPHPRTWIPARSDIADPLALEKAYEEGRLEALRRMEQAGQPGVPVSASFGQVPLARGTAAAHADTRGTALTGEGAAARSKSQAAGSAYENAGKWIAQPTS
uniref:cell wall hydrolase n=1 Tax=Novosphingobium sp. Chol11 TaxID=1385763 RepID=UPI0025CC4805